MLLATSQLPPPAVLGDNVTFSNITGSQLTLDQLTVKNLYVKNIYSGDDVLPDVYFFGCPQKTQLLFSDGTATPGASLFATTPTVAQNLILLPEPIAYNATLVGDPFQPYVAAFVNYGAVAFNGLPTRDSGQGYVYDTTSGASTAYKVPISNLVPTVYPALNAAGRMYGLYIALNANSTVFALNQYRATWYVIGTSTDIVENITPTNWTVPTVGALTAPNPGYHVYPVTFPGVNGESCIQGTCATFPTTPVPIPITSSISAPINPAYPVSSLTPQATLNALWLNNQLVDGAGNPTCSQGIWIQQIWIKLKTGPGVFDPAYMYNITHLFTAAGNVANTPTPPLTGVGVNIVNSFKLGQKQPDGSFTISIELPDTLSVPAANTPYYLKQYSPSSGLSNTPDLFTLVDLKGKGTYYIVLGTVSQSLSVLNTKLTTNLVTGAIKSGFSTIWPGTNTIATLAGGGYAAAPTNNTGGNAWPLQPTVAYGMDGVGTNAPPVSLTGVNLYPTGTASSLIAYPPTQMVVCVVPP